MICLGTGSQWNLGKWLQQRLLVETDLTFKKKMAITQTLQAAERTQRTNRQILKLFWHWISSELQTYQGPPLQELLNVINVEVHGIRRWNSAPHHPAINRLAKWAVQIVKVALTKTRPDNIKIQLTGFFFNYSTTPQVSSLQSYLWVDL